LSLIIYFFSTFLFFFLSVFLFLTEIPFACIRDLCHWPLFVFLRWFAPGGESFGTWVGDGWRDEWMGETRHTYPLPPTTTLPSPHCASTLLGAWNSPEPPIWVLVQQREMTRKWTKCDVIKNKAPGCLHIRGACACACGCWLLFQPWGERGSPADTHPSRGGS